MEYLRSGQASSSILQQVNNYFDFKWAISHGLNQNRLSQMLPPSLVEELNVFLKAKMIESVDLFQETPATVIQNLAHFLEERSV